MAVEESGSDHLTSWTDDLKNEIAYLEYQYYHINVNLEGLRQTLEGIDFFFAHFGHYYKFNVVTQMMLYQRHEKEQQFDKLCDDLYATNKCLLSKKDQLGKLVLKSIKDQKCNQ